MTHININKRLSILSRRPDIFLHGSIAMMIHIKDGPLLFVGCLVQIFGKALNGSREWNVAPIVATDNDLAGQVGNEHRRGYHGNYSKLLLLL
jgi:hypothetical protein